MLRKNLSINDKSLLNIIYKYGGYIRVKYLIYLYPDITERAYLLKLDKLVMTSCLTKRRFLSNSKREPVTYQITQAGCNMCGNINSTYRRKRPKEYAYRALLKCAFFLEIHSELSDYIISNVNDRRIIFEEEGFSNKYFPKKINIDKTNNKNVSIIQFEEYIIDFRKNEGKSILYNGDILYTDELRGVIVTYIDQPHIEINKQIATLLNRYILMINEHINNNIGFSINFLVVVDSDNRYEIYNDFLNKFLKNARYQERISDLFLRLYLTFYEKLAKKDIKYTDKFIECDRLYRSDVLRKEFVKRAKNYSYFDKENRDYLKNNIITNGIKYISDEIYNIVKSNENNLETAKLLVEDLFDKVASLEYNNEIYLDENREKMKYDIKVYKTKISVFE